MKFHKTFTWREGECDLIRVRGLRKTAHGWGVTSTMRRKNGNYTLTFTSEKPADFDMVEVMFKVAKRSAFDQLADQLGGADIASLFGKYGRQ